MGYFFVILLGTGVVALLTYLFLFAYKSDVTMLLALNESSLRELSLSFSLMLTFFWGTKYSFFSGRKMIGLSLLLSSLAYLGYSKMEGYFYAFFLSR